MGIGEPDQLELVDWHKLYARADDDQPVIAGIAFRGRWTAIASPAKAGKSTVLLGLAVAVARSGLDVLYIDAEMGRGDILERVEDWLKLTPDDLEHLHYCDLPRMFDTVAGAAILAHTVDELKPALVVFDGLNGVVIGEENDDTTWRDLYANVIAPMKAMDIAIVSADNLGKAKAQGPRGSSVKMDKADAVLIGERTDNGFKLTASHRRTAAYPSEQTLVVEHADEDGPPMSIRPADGDFPAGTKEKVAELDDHDVPRDASVRQARRLLEAAGITPGRNAVLAAALRYRRGSPLPAFTPLPGNSLNAGNGSGNTPGNTSNKSSVTRVPRLGVYEVTPTNREHDDNSRMENLW